MYCIEFLLIRKKNSWSSFGFSIEVHASECFITFLHFVITCSDMVITCMLIYIIFSSLKNGSQFVYRRG